LRPLESRLGRLNREDPTNAELIRRLESHYHWNAGGAGERLDASGLDLSGKLLDGIDFGEAWFTSCVFDGAQIRGANMAGVELRKCSFIGADLTATTFAKAETWDCAFRNATLREANFLRWGNFRADFREADLAGAELRLFACHDGDLRDAIFWDATLDRACFDSCLLVGAGLVGVTGTLLPYPINVGSRVEPRLLEGEEALDWLRAAGAMDVTWFVPAPR
jgi:uncharacterized protein YjbI with pentapeptide repeats